MTYADSRLSITRRPDRVPLPYIFESLGQGLLFHGAVGVPGVTRKYKLIGIALGGQHFGHVLIREDPAVQVVACDQIVPVADPHPNTYRLGRWVGVGAFWGTP